MKVAILDDYLDTVLRIADWGSLPADTNVERFTDHLEDENALAERLAPFDIIVAKRERTPFPRTLLERLPNLKLMVVGRKHNQKIDIATATELGIYVTGTERFGTAAAELTWGLILSLMRNIPGEDRAVREGRWHDKLGHILEGKTLGVIGLGRIGPKIAALGNAFDMSVIAWSQNMTPDIAGQAGAKFVEKDDLFRNADIITVHVALSDRTRRLIGAREIELMKKSAYLVNTARGPIIDEAALIEALERNAIAGAGLDVFEKEPLPADHPFRQLDNVIVTPHIGYVTEESFRAYYQSAVENIRAFLNNESIPRLLNQPENPRK
ncbi:MAG: D-2-hydroxyacid dehydrogenase family protein [Rhodospirillaceae bacterium]|jgi:phosphoglycerate dehydrogenase-like enzyme